MRPKTLAAAAVVIAAGSIVAFKATSPRADRLGWRVWVDRLSGAVLVALGFYLLWTA